MVWDLSRIGDEQVKQPISQLPCPIRPLTFTGHDDLHSLKPLSPLPPESCMGRALWLFPHLSKQDPLGMGIVWFTGTPDDVQILSLVSAVLLPV